MAEPTIDEPLPREREAAATDLDAFERFYREHDHRVGRFLAAFMRDRSLAEEVAQDSFLAAYRDRANIPRADRAQQTWILGIAHHRALHALRGARRAREALGSLALTLRRSEPSRSALGTRDILIRTLAPLDRSIVVLSLVHGYTSEETAAMVGLSAEAVRQRLTRGRRKLEQAIREADGDA